MIRLAGRVLVCVLVTLTEPASAQSPASPTAEQSQPVPPEPPSPDDICRAVEEDAAANGLPVEFFARVIWQESRFNAQTVSPKGARGIAQFMPQTADWRGTIKNIADGDSWQMPATIDDSAVLDEIGSTLKGRGLGG
jgi:Transglycosylase SLT domain